MIDTLKDPRAYLQKRVALFTGVSWPLFTVFLLVDWALPAEGESILSSTRIAPLVMAISNAAVWVYTRRGERPAWACRTLELTTMAVGTGMFGMLPVVPPVEGAGGAMGLFMPLPLAVVILLRAAIIPSPAWLSVAVGLIWGGVMTVTSVIGWEGISITIPGQPNDRQWLMPVVLNLYATFGFAFVAGVISHVVFGLQTKVREAMQLGQYTLEAKIGEGGMGAVYLARHRMLRRPTAVKLLPPEKAGEEAIARFEREVQQTSRLTHPNTVAIFDFGRTQDGIFYYAMEYIDGISLQDLVDMAGPVPPERVVHILAQAAEALTEAHEMGLVHRDIKPANIMLCERGGVADVVKVLDFGLVKDVAAPADTELSAVDTVRGTPLYMAPESVTDPDSVDGRTDLYALGAVAYFLLAGEPVFSGNVVEVFGHHLHSQPKPLGEYSDAIDRQVDSIVLRCLEKDPDDRYQSAAELVEALHACADAGTWTRSRARTWWDRERGHIESRRGAPEPASLTVAPA